MPTTNSPNKQPTHRKAKYKFICSSGKRLKQRCLISGTYNIILEYNNRTNRPSETSAYKHNTPGNNQKMQNQTHNIYFY